MGKPEINRPLERPRGRQEDNTEIVLGWGGNLEYRGYIVVCK
jgi:hypothetical protein